MESIDMIESYAYGTSRDLISEEEKIWCRKIAKKKKKKIKKNTVIKEETKEHNHNWPKIPNNPFRILITGGFGSWKTNSLFNWIS